MSTTADLRELGGDMKALAAAINGPDGVAIRKGVAKQLDPIAAKAVRRDLGDASMSGWATGAIIGVAFIKGDAVVVTPKGKSGGPFRVLESGRNQGGVTGPTAPGRTTRRNKGGGVSVSGRKAKRWNGRTKPKYTWSEAMTDMERESPKLLEAAIVEKVGGWFGG